MSLFMFGIISAICIVCGGVVAHISTRSSPYTDSLTTLASILLIGGLVILGVKLRSIIEAVNF